MHLTPRWFVQSKPWMGLLALVMLVLPLSGCPIDVLDEPQILTMNITPSVISRSETGMTDEFFTVTMQVVNFDEEIPEDGVEVYIELDNPRPAVPQQVIIEGDTITLTGIEKAWFQGLPVGTYDIGASVRTDTVSVRQNRLASVTITE